MDQTAGMSGCASSSGLATTSVPLALCAAALTSSRQQPVPAIVTVVASFRQKPWGTFVVGGEPAGVQLEAVDRVVQRGDVRHGAGLARLLGAAGEFRHHHGREDREDHQHEQELDEGEASAETCAKPRAP